MTCGNVGEWTPLRTIRRFKKSSSARTERRSINKNPETGKRIPDRLQEIAGPGKQSIDEKRASFLKNLVEFAGVTFPTDLRMKCCSTVKRRADE